MPRTVTLLSGGLDSSTLAYLLAEEGHEQTFLSFDYGQKHVKELRSASWVAGVLKGEHHIVDLRSLQLLLRSSLTTKEEVPDGHYAEDTMRSTVVPNRNAIMLSIAYGLASSIGADSIAIAAHGGDHYQYPDCRPNFFAAFIEMEGQSLFGFHVPVLRAPFIQSTKTDIARKAFELNVPIDLTWSCYKGGEYHCGRCGTCVERLEALNEARVPDRTVYDDPQYYHSVIHNR